MSQSTDEVEQYAFVPLQDPAALRQESTVRLVRSHAARCTRQRARLREQQLQQNFRVCTVKDMKSRVSQETSPSEKRSVAPLVQPDLQMIDPFNILPRCSSRFQQLLESGTYNPSEKNQNPKTHAKKEYAKAAGEPVFTLGSTTPFRSSANLYQSCLTDPAFMNALMLSLAFAENGSQMSVECWTYRGEAMRNIASLMETDQTALSELTIGAILVLTGVEYRLGSQNSHATHMSGLAHILRLEKATILSDSTRRSIFWQDLNGAMISGCDRLFDHTSFSALYWNRSQVSHCDFNLPHGLNRVSSMFSAEMITVLEDLNGFRLLRDSSGWDLSNLDLLVYIDNAQAWNESRLLNVQRQAETALNPMVNCSLMGAYICSYSLFSEIWAGTFITCLLSKRLLHQLNEIFLGSLGKDESDLFLWLVFIGGAFSVDQNTRTGYVKLVRLHAALSASAMTWEETMAILRLFIWSDSVFLDQSHALWNDSQATERLTVIGD